MKSYLKKIWHESAILNNLTLRSCVEEANTAKVLDVGCGDGHVLIEQIMINKISNLDAYGLDINSKSKKEAEKRGIKVTLSNVEKKFPFKSNFFDLVIANQIIEHLSDVDYFVTEIHRVLKPGGYLLLSTENLSSWHNVFALILGWQPFSSHISAKKNVGNPYRLASSENFPLEGMHIKIFTPRALKEIMILHKFKIETFFGAGYYPFPATLSKILSKIDPTHTAFVGIKVRKVDEN